MGEAAIGTYKIGTKDVCSQKNQMFWPVRANLEIFNGGITTKRHSGTPNDVELVFDQIWPNNPKQIILERLALGDALLQFRDNPSTDPRLYQPANNWIKAIRKRLPSKLSFVKLHMDVRVEYTDDNEVLYPADLIVTIDDGNPEQKFTFYEFPELLSKLNMLYLLDSGSVEGFFVSWAKAEEKLITTILHDRHDHAITASAKWIDPIWKKYSYSRPLGVNASIIWDNSVKAVDHDDDK